MLYVWLTGGLAIQAFWAMTGGSLR